VRSVLLAAALWASVAGSPAALFASGQAEAGAGGTRAIIDSGHAGAVSAMEFDEKRGLLFTSGEDGTVRIWDPVAGNLLHTLRITQLAAGRLAVNPSASQVAVVVGDAGDVSLAVWDWDLERQIYRVPLREAPLFLRWSALGTYLLYGESTWQGLKILRASDGTPVPFHPEGFGIVGFAETSRSEKTLMTYQVSGRITYWDLATGAQSVDVPTVPYLTGIRISRDRGVLVGFTDSEVVRVDAVAGTVRGRAPAPGLRAVDISPTGDEIASVGAAPRRWAVSGDTLQPGPAFPALPTLASMLVYGSAGLYFAGTGGDLVSLSPAGDVSTFGRNAVAALTGFDVKDNGMAMASRSWVRVFSADWSAGSPSPAAIHTQLAPNPFSDAAGLAFLGDGRLLAWKSAVGSGAGSEAVSAAGSGAGSAVGSGAGSAAGSGAGSAAGIAPCLAVLDTSTNASASASTSAEGSTPAPAFSTLPNPFRAPLLDLRATAQELVGIEAGGTLRVVDPATGLSRFESRITGGSAAVRVSRGEIVAARNAAGGLPGSLVRITMATGETVAIHDRNLFTYALLFDGGAAGGPVLYSIGVDAARSTNLLRHDGPGFERETLLDHVATEDLDASLSFDPVQRVLYATLGRDRAVAWDGQSLSVLSLESSVPRKLLVRNGLAFLVNRDSTVTVADARTGDPRALVALFSDGEWAAVFANGRYAASTGGDLHVRVFAEGAPVKATEDYRLRIDTR